MFRRHFELCLTLVVAVTLAAFLRYPPPPMSFDILAWNNTGQYMDHKGYSIFYKGTQKFEIAYLLFIVLFIK